MSAPRLRSARGDDAPRLAELWSASRRTAAGIPPAAHDDEEVRAWIGELVGDREVWVAVDEGDRPDAMMVLRDEWIEQLYVAPGRQGRGLGTGLIDLAQGSRQSLALWTFEANAGARRFYEARGFRPSGETSSENEEQAPALCYRWSRRTNGPQRRRAPSRGALRLLL